MSRQLLCWHFVRILHCVMRVVLVQVSQGPILTLEKKVDENAKVLLLIQWCLFCKITLKSERRKRWSPNRGDCIYAWEQ